MFSFSPQGIRRKWILLCAFFVLLLAQGCSAPRLDPTTPEGMGAILDLVHIALNQGDCAKAVANIEGVYNSVYSNNAVRMARAASHGCYAEVEFFTMMLALSSDPPIGSKFWKNMAEMFYNETQLNLDKQITSAGYGIDALMSLLNPGIVVANSYQINPTGFNPASMLVTDRTSDSAVGLMLMSMASIGALEDRYSDPDTGDWVKTQDLGYTTAAPAGWAEAVNTSGDGCQFAASVLNVVDAMAVVGAGRTDTLGTTLTTIASDLGDALTMACLGGCKGTVETTAGIAIDYSGSGCSFTDDLCGGDESRACLAALRDRTSCTGVVTDRSSCAAAGIARFINEHTVLGWN